MGKLILARLSLAATLAFAAPAYAQSAFPDEMDADIARSLPHPYDIEEAGDKMDRAVGAILDVPIGGLVQAIDPTAHIHPDETIADIAGRDDPYFESRIQDDLRGMTLKMADVVRGMAVMAPLLRRSFADLERNLAGAMRDPGY